MLPDAYLAVVDGLPDAALLFRDGVLVHLNAGARARLTDAGVLSAATPLESLDVTAAVVEQDRPRLREAMRQAAAGRAVPAIRLTLAGGSLVASCVFNPLELDGRPYLQVLARDVADRAHAEAALIASEAQFRAIFDDSTIGVGIAEDGRFAVVNDALCGILGYSRAELVGLTSVQVTLPDDLPVNAAVSQTLNEGGVARVQKRYLRADGTVLWGEPSTSRRTPA